MKKVIFIGVFLSLTGLIFAQSGKKALQTAYGAYSNQYYDKAQKAIDEAITYDDTKADAKTWFYRGTIYLMIELMKDTKDSVFHKKLCSNCAEIAFESYMKANEIDKELKVPTMRIQTVQDGLKYCSERLLIDAVRALMTDDKESAYKWAKMAYKANSLDTNAVFYAGYTAELAKQYDEAKSYYMELMKFKSYKSIQPYSRLASIYQEEKDTARAVKVMQNGAAIFLQDTAFNVDYAVVYSIIMAWAEKSEEVFEMYENALQKAPENYTLLTNYASDLLKREKYDEAEQYFKRAAEIKPNDATANFNLSNCYFRKYAAKLKEINDIVGDEDYQKAKEESKLLLETAKPYAEKAHELDPEDVSALRLLKGIYMQSGAREEEKVIDEKLNALQGGGGE